MGLARKRAPSRVWLAPVAIAHWPVPPCRLAGQRSLRDMGPARRDAMLDRLGLPRPQIATKLYGAIALSLAVVYLLAAAIIQFAGRTEEAVGWVREEALQSVVLAQEAEASLEQQRQLVGSASSVTDHSAIERAERDYKDRNAKLA